MKNIIIHDGRVPLYQFKVLKQKEYNESYLIFMDETDPITFPLIRLFLAKCEDAGYIKIKKIDTTLINFNSI